MYIQSSVNKWGLKRSMILSILKDIFKYTYSYTNQHFLFLSLALILMCSLNLNDSKQGRESFWEKIHKKDGL